MVTVANIKDSLKHQKKGRLTNDKLSQLEGGIGSLHETDIFKMCVKTLEQNQIELIIPSGSQDLSKEQIQETCVKAFYRAWAAYTKYLHNQVINKGVVLSCNVFGIFTLISNINGLKQQDSDVVKVTYIPTAELAKNGNFSYQIKEPINLECSTIEKLVSKTDINENKVVKVNYYEIAKNAGLTEVVLQYLLRQVLIGVEAAARKDYKVKINLKVGLLRISHNQLQFENNSTNNDQLSKSSCNTQFQTNKRMMASLQLQSPMDEIRLGSSGTFKSGSLKDAISQMSQSKTSKHPASLHGSVVNLKNQRFGEQFLFARANPNTIDLKITERQSRILNPIVEGKYSKRMSIQGKDLYHDYDILRNHRKDLLEQALQKKEVVFEQKVEKKEKELDLISQIQDALQDVVSRKQNLLYKQRLVLSDQLNQQVQDRKLRQQMDEKFKQIPYDYFPFNNQEQVIAKSLQIQNQRKEEMRESLAQQALTEKQRQVRRQEQRERHRSEVIEPNERAASMIKPLSDFGYAKDVMDDALRRYEESIHKQNDERLLQREQMFDEIKVIQNQENQKKYARLQKGKILGSQLQHQFESDRKRNEIEAQNEKLYVKPHFGPDEPDANAVINFQKLRIQNVSDGVTSQIEQNQQRRAINKQVELLEDIRCNRINNLVVQEEDLLNEEHKRQKSKVLKEALIQQDAIRKVQHIADKKYEKLLP